MGVGEWRGGSYRAPYLDTDGQWEWENGGEAPIGSHTWTQTGSGSGRMEGRLLSGPIPGRRRAVGVGEWRGGSYRVPYLDTDGQWEWENGGEALIGPHTWTQTGSGSGRMEGRLL